MIVRTFASICAATLAATAAFGAEDIEAFYKGKSIDLIIASEVGGGYDAYARLIAPYMEKHLPGNPRFVAKQMVGAGGIIATNYLANVARKDGTAIAQVQNTVPFQPLFAPETAKFQPTELGYLGSANSEVSLAFVWKTSPTQSFMQLRERETLMAGVTGSISSQYARAMNELAGTKIKVVVGYRGASQALMAVEQGEVEGYPAIFWSTLKVTKEQWLEKKDITLIAQMALKKHPELPDVPLMLDHIDTAKNKQIAELLFAPQVGGRPFITPPGIPPERLKALREAFAAAIRDPEFLAEARKRKLEIQYTSGPDLLALVERAFKSPADAVAQVRRIYDGK
ncbi:MAG: Bug family tripartite tricarboxylate transporter substrate binding protein [Beijerinckiaceae bacterium]